MQFTEIPFIVMKMMSNLKNVQPRNKRKIKIILSYHNILHKNIFQHKIRKINNIKVVYPF